MRHLPKALIYSRLVLGLLIIGSNFFDIENYSAIVVTLFTIGLVTDIFDGIIARRLNISTESLRRLDSMIDQVFFILVTAATFIHSPHFFYENKFKLLLLGSAEAIAYLICYLKFKKEVATHAILSKVWALILFATLIQIMTTNTSTTLFELCFYVGIVTRLEIILILLILPYWINDVPSLYHAIQLKNGKPIKRHKLFNG